MTDTMIAQSDPVLVAIDISKARHEVLIAVPGKKRRRRITVLNQLEDFNRLIAALAGYGRRVRVAIEATGNYHRALAYHLAEAGFEMKLVSSVALARTREALNNSWDKNDPKDAQVILHMMEIGNEQFYHDPLMRGTNDIQELSKTHDIVSKSKTELWHRILTHYLPLYFPEADRFHRSSRSDWFFAFLEQYPSPHFITAMGKDAFIADAWNVVGRKVSKERLLADIYETAKASVGLPVAPDSDAIAMFRLVLAEGRSLIAQRNKIEDRAVALLQDHPDYQLLTSIPGIGPINALTILAGAGDIRRFRHHKQFLKFCGMDLATIRSGTFRGQTKLSKYGNARLRRTLWMAGQVAILQRTNGFRDKFERYIAKDRHNTDLRRKARLEGLVSYIAGTSGGLPGERILRQIGVRISDDTLLRSLKNQAKTSEETCSPRVVGIDEWSWRYKAQYGTIMVDLENRKVIDVLDNRDTDVVRAWFEKRPEIEVVSRDRCSNFARAAREGAPQAAQVADRFHILDNFKHCIEKQLQLRRHTARYAMQALAPYQTQITHRKLIATGGISEAARHEARVKISKLRTRAALFTKAQTMANEGLPIAQIARELGFKTRTISNWLRNGEMPTRKQMPPTKTSPKYFESFLKEQWDAGETNGGRLLNALCRVALNAEKNTVSVSNLLLILR